MINRTFETKILQINNLRDAETLSKRALEIVNHGNCQIKRRMHFTCDQSH